jgi:hypothetical protein
MPKANKYGCRKSGDVCMVHQEPLICPHGCTKAIPHKCKDYIEWDMQNSGESGEKQNATK